MFSTSSSTWLIGLASLVLAAPLAADTLHVPADFPTIPQAIAAATEGDTILVAPGSYVGPIALDKKLLLVASDGPAVTTLDGAGGPLVSADGLVGDGAGLVGFTLTGGAGLPQPDGVTRGGALHLVNSAFRVERCVFVDNHVSGDGGALFATADVQRKLSVYLSRFSDNSAGGRGGAVAITGVVFPGGSSVNGSDFRRNHAVGDGGALWMQAQRTPTTNADWFEDNHSGGSGGALALDFERSALPQSCVFRGNTAALDGGAVAVQVAVLPVSALPLNLNFSALQAFDNSAGRDGGALWLHASLGVTPTGDLAFNKGIGTYDSLFVRNHASGRGGAVYQQIDLAEGPPGAPTERVLLENCTLVGNTADVDADSVRYGSELSASPLASKLIVRDITEAPFVGQIPAVSFSDIEGGFPGEGNLDADPRFFDPAHDVYALRSSSPARGAGPDGGDLGFTPYSPFADHARSLPGEWGHAELQGVVVENSSGSVTYTLDLEFARPGAAAFLVLGFDDLYAPFKQGVLVPRPDVISAPITLGVHPESGSGWVQLPNNFLSEMLGRERSSFVQFWFDDPSAPAGFAASNALSLTTPTTP